jgi:hypothetical protein
MSCTTRERSPRRSAAERALALFGCALLSFACSADASRGPASARPLPNTRDAPGSAAEGRGSRSPRTPGPFDGLRWSGRSVPVDALLHDDGRRLWSTTLDGRRALVWRHPPATVAALAAAPDGERVAISVALEPRTASQTAFLLYLLDEDGSVRLIDRTTSFRSIDSPVFLRPPTASDAAPARLYWLRTGEEIDGLGRLDTHVMVLDGGPRTVRVPLRFAEAVFDIEGYAGASTFTLTLFRQNDVPTRAEVLRNDDDRARTTNAGLTLWGNNEPRAQTDVLNGVAWVSPTDYVVPVAQRFHPKGYTLRLYRVGCEQLGSMIVYRGRGIDWGYADLPWRLQPAGRDRILVLPVGEARTADPVNPVGVAWRAIDLATGRIQPTGVEWAPGPWTWVQRDAARRSSRPGCSGVPWTWP